MNIRQYMKLLTRHMADTYDLVDGLVFSFKAHERFFVMSSASAYDPQTGMLFFSADTVTRVLKEDYSLFVTPEDLAWSVVNSWMRGLDRRLSELRSHCQIIQIRHDRRR